MPDRFSTSRIFQITPTSTPGITQALTTATRAASAPTHPPAFGGVEQPREQQAHANCSATESADEHQRDAHHAVELRVGRQGAEAVHGVAIRPPGRSEIRERHAHQLEHRIQQKEASTSTTAGASHRRTAARCSAMAVRAQRHRPATRRHPGQRIARRPRAAVVARRAYSSRDGRESGIHGRLGRARALDG